MSANWAAATTNATDAPYTLKDGMDVLGTVDKNQELPPSSLIADRAVWEDLGVYLIDSGTLTVELKNNADQCVVADAIRAERIIVGYIDNGAQGFSTTGSWSSDGDGFLNDQHWAAGVGTQNPPTATATWTFSGLMPGQYRISATWEEDNSYATNSPFAFYDDDTLLESVSVNQQLTPNDFSESGASWEDLGTATITSGTLVVKLLNNVDAQKYVLADAIRIEQIV